MQVPPLAFADVETLGLNPLHHRVIEIGYASIQDDDWTDFSVDVLRFTPSRQDLILAQPEALKVNGYYAGHPDWVSAPVCDSDEAVALWRKVAEDLRGYVLVNQNVAFDRKFTYFELCRHKVSRHDCAVGASTPYSSMDDAATRGPWASDSFEIRNYSNKFAKDGGLASRSLGPVYAYLNGPPMKMHTSRSDVLAAMWIYANGVARIDNNSERGKRIMTCVLRYIDEHGLRLSPKEG
jgi:hypothetical protein